MFAFGRVAARISPSVRIGTPGRSVSRQEPEQVEGEGTEEAIQQSGDKSIPRQESDFEGEADVISEVEMESETESVSEAEMDSENDGEENHGERVVRWGGRLGLQTLMLAQTDWLRSWCLMELILANPSPEKWDIVFPLKVPQTDLPDNLILFQDCTCS